MSIRPRPPPRPVFYDWLEATSKVVAWLVALDGPGAGRSFEIRAGRNTIGSGDECSVWLDFDPAIDVEAGSIVYHPLDKSHRLVPNLAADPLPRVAGENALVTTDLQDRQVIEFGRSKFLYVMLCSPSFDYEVDWTEMIGSIGGAAKT